MGLITFKYRIKGHERHLDRMATACNQVWNFCVATTQEATRRQRTWPSAFDLINLTSGSNASLGINADTVAQICRRFAHARNQQRQCPRFRVSFGTKRSLGWVAFQSARVQIAQGHITYRKRAYQYWNSRPWEGDLRSGAFVQDARGRWYVTLQCEVPDNLSKGGGTIGIDLGLKDLATMSDGGKIPALRHYRRYQSELATAQRANNRKRVRAIHAKITNSRRHHLHEQSTRIARENSTIVVGNVNAASLAKTKMAKSVLDAGWSAFRSMLRYKAARRQAVYIEADERYSSQTCSACGTIPASSPKGMGALGIRHWECSDCGASHDRDVNAARNILRVGLECQPPAGGTAARRADGRIKDRLIENARSQS